MPSTLTTVANSSLSVVACTMWATHSRPTFVDRAYWYGAVDSATTFQICWAIVLATKRLKMSPTVMPLTPPSFLRSAVMRPILTQLTTSKRYLLWPRCQCEQLRKIPLISQQGLQMVCNHARWSCCSASFGQPEIQEESSAIQQEWVVGASIRNVLRNGTPRDKWTSILVPKLVQKISRVPGTNSAPSKAWRAEEASPNWTNLRALAARRFTSSPRCRPLRKNKNWPK